MSRTLRVYPNPWAARDMHGLPCGVCPRDPDSDGGGPGQFVGARVSRAATKVLQEVPEQEQQLRSPMQRTVYEYLGVPSSDPELAAKLAAADPITVPRTKYYRQRIAEGALIAADEETAQAGRRPFIDPAKHFARFRPKPKANPEQESAPDASTSESAGSSGASSPAAATADSPASPEPSQLEQGQAQATTTKGRKPRSEVTQ